MFIRKVFFCAFLLLYLSEANSQTLKIYHIDVDQGGSTLFIAPNGKTLLVDAGKNGHGQRIKKILQKEGLTRIDHFVNTHYHEDHYGGVDELATDPSITIGTAYDRGDRAFLSTDKLNEETYKDYWNTLGNRAIQLTRGTQIPLDNAMTVTCISHGGVVLGETNPIAGTDENDLSVTLLIKYGNFRYFIGGDIEAATEIKIAQRDLVMGVDIYQANHHGSHTSSSRNFMNDLLPTVVVISNGSNEKYYHPRQVTLNTFSQLTPPPTVFQTNKYLGTKAGAGNVANEFIADLDTNGDEGTILAEVSPGGNSFTIKYGTIQKTFTIKNRGQNLTQVGNLVIEKLLPDPTGSEVDKETVTIKNKTSETILLSGWTLKDASNRVWVLDSYTQITAGQSLVIKRKKMPMSLNNDGDQIYLMSPTDQVIDQFQYVGSVSGVTITTGH